MFNKIHAYFDNQHKGWDPISDDYAQSYADYSNANFDATCVEELNLLCGNLQGKTLIDLGGGPGQYTIALAKYGAKVTWRDVSKNYMQIVQQQVLKENLNINFQLQYMDTATGSFDVVFNRVCFHYCINDYAFLKTIYNLMNEKGVAYLMLHNENMANLKNKNRVKRLYKYIVLYLNTYVDIKIGHPPFAKYKLKKMLSKYPFSKVIIQEHGIHTKVVLFK